MHLFILRLKFLLRNKGNLFWTFLFPLLLGTFFYLGFGNLSEDSTIATMDAYVANEQADHPVVNLLKQLTIDEDKRLFDLHTTYTREELDKKLTNQQITGYIDIIEDEIIYHINENGLTQTITKGVLDQFVQSNDLIETVVVSDPTKIPAVTSDLSHPKTFFKGTYSSTDAKANRLVIYFYALVSMQAMYGSIWGVGLVRDLQANMSSRAMRVSVSPTHKIKFIIIHFLTALLINFIGGLLLLGYLNYVLGVEFADQLGVIILAILIGSIGGIAFGSVLSALIKGSSNTKEAIISLISTALGFFSGLMSVDIKYMFNKAVPFMKYINPSNLLTDALFSLYYYEEMTKFYMNLSILTFISILLLGATYFLLRGTKYDSI